MQSPLLNEYLICLPYFLDFPVWFFGLLIWVQIDSFNA